MNERGGKWEATEGFALSYSSWRTRERSRRFQVGMVGGYNYTLLLYGPNLREFNGKLCFREREEPSEGFTQH